MTIPARPMRKVLRILVVDDDDDMCWALERFIRMEGHQATAVTNASAAVRVLEQQPFDLVFADVKLPDMDGFELVRSIRPGHPNLPCVLVSGFYYNNDDAVQKRSDRPTRHRLSLEAVSSRSVQEDHPACLDLLNDMRNTSPHSPRDRHETRILCFRSGIRRGTEVGNPLPTRDSDPRLGGPGARFAEANWLRSIFARAAGTVELAVSARRRPSTGT